MMHNENNANQGTQIPRYSSPNLFLIPPDLYWCFHEASDGSITKYKLRKNANCFSRETVSSGDSIQEKTLKAYHSKLYKSGTWVFS